MKKIIAFLQNSNHYKHLIGGFIVSWLTASPYAGIYAAVVAATCLEAQRPALWQQVRPHRLAAHRCRRGAGCPRMDCHIVHL